MSETFTLEKAPERSEGPETLPEDSEVSAVVKWVERKKMPFQDRDTGADVFKVKWTFELKGPEHQFTDREGEVRQRKVIGETSTVFNDSPMCKLRAWITEVLGADTLPAGFRLQLGDLVGNDCTVVLTVDEWADKRVPQAEWEENPVTGVKEAPRRRTNKVKDVIRPRPESASTGGSFTMDDVASGTQPQADSSFDEEPF